MDYMTPKQAALVCGKHPETITAALRDKELCGHQRIKNGRWTITKGCLDAWLVGGTCAHVAPAKAA